MTNPVWMAGMAPMEANPAKPATRQQTSKATSPHHRARLIGAGLLILAGLAPSLAPLHSARAQARGPQSEEITAEGQGMGDEEVQRIPVTFYRADLATAPGARDLVARIDRAALTVCGDSTAIGSELRRAIERSDCRRDAVMRAVRDVNDLNVDYAAGQYDLED